MWGWLVATVSSVAFCLAPRAHGFDFQDVEATALARAARPYQASTNVVPKALADLKYEAFQQISFIGSRALWATNDLPFRIEFFHLGHFHLNPIRVHEVVDGRARIVPFRTNDFNYGTNQLSLQAELAYAGFRVVKAGQDNREIAVFLDASYFRMIGIGQEYGLSARGLCLDTVLGPKEEFPAFEEFWICRPRPRDKELVVLALMDSPSVTGAYRFTIQPGSNTTVQVKATLVQRKGVKEFGVAPLSSMFLHGKNGRPFWHDFRPEVHDSDGLLIHTGAKEWIWHPLEAGKMMRVNAFADEDPKGFGLIQRERNFEQYQDLVATFQARPNAWIRPRGKWGKGAVELIQLNSLIEFADNVVAFWVPHQLPTPGQPIAFEYEMEWTLDDPLPPAFGKVIASRVSRVPDTKNLRFVIDFGGRAVERISGVEHLSFELKCSDNVKFIADSIRKNGINQTWRLVLEIVEPDKAADLSAFLVKDGRPITEKWTFTWQP